MVQADATATKKASVLRRSTREHLEQASFLSAQPEVTASVLADVAALPEPAAIAQQLQEPGWHDTGRALRDVELGNSLQGPARSAFHLQQLLAQVGFWWQTRDAGVTAASVARHATSVQGLSCSGPAAAQQQLAKPPQLISALLVGIWNP
jgi:hypothetical protein